MFCTVPLRKRVPEALEPVWNLFKCALRPLFRRCFIGKFSHRHRYAKIFRLLFDKNSLGSHYSRDTEQALRTLAGLSSPELAEVIGKVTASIEFVDETTLSSRLILDTERVLAAADLKDVPFVALARNQCAKLWTGDKALVRGLQAEYPKLAISTLDLWLLMEQKEH